MEYPKFKVCCRCFTFNQSRYITDTLDGFTMQQTSFPFVCTIVDDASTDGEQEVIRKYVEENFDLSEDSVAFHKETDYAHITYAQHKTNKNCYFAVLYLKENHYSPKKNKFQYLEEWRGMCEYEAMCEGDDFWTDPLKLQKECEYLDINPEKSLVYTDCNVFFHDQNKLINDAFKSCYFKNTTNYKDFFLEGKYIAPCSWVYKLKDYDDIVIPDFATDGTLCKAFVLLLNDKVGYIEDTTCTYRVVHSGASHNGNLVVRYNYLMGVFKTEQAFLSNYSDYFNESDVHYLYNKRYKSYIPFAVALNDRLFLKEIKDFHVKNMGWRNKIILLFSWLPLARLYIYKRLCSSAKKGL